MQNELGDCSLSSFCISRYYSIALLVKNLDKTA